MKINRLRFVTACLVAGLGAAAAFSPGCDDQTTPGQNDQDLGPDLEQSLAPTVTQATPGVVANTGGTTVTLTGENFKPGATVTIEGASANAVFNSATSLTVTVPAKAAFCGPASVSVQNPDGKSGSATNLLRYKSSQFGFLAAKTSTGNSLTAPRNLVLADFNADKKIDALVSLMTAGNVGFMAGTGGDTFGAVSATAVGSQPRDLAAGFFDADNNLDVAVTNAGAGTVSVLLGQGNGSFTVKQTVTAGNSPNAIEVRDFNRDGKPDLAIANAGGGTGTASLMIAFGKGDGTFNTPSSTSLPVGCTGMATGDLNGDGYFDIAVAHGAQGQASVHIGKGDGTFGTPSMVNLGGAGGQANDVVMADLNGDQKQDLAVANSATGNIAVQFGKGDGTFGNAPQITATNGSGPNSLIAVDVNEDGFMDILTANGGGANLSLLLGTTGGVFSAGVPFAVGNSPRFLASSDLNGDLQPDIVSSNATSGNVSVLLSQCK